MLFIFFSSTQGPGSASEPHHSDTFCKVNCNTPASVSGRRSRMFYGSVGSRCFCSVVGYDSPWGHMWGRVGPRGRRWPLRPQAGWWPRTSGEAPAHCWRSQRCRSGQIEEPDLSTTSHTASRSCRSSSDQLCRRGTWHTGWTDSSSPHLSCTAGTDVRHRPFSTRKSQHSARWRTSRRLTSWTSQ